MKGVPVYWLQVKYYTHAKTSIFMSKSHPSSISVTSSDLDLFNKVTFKPTLEEAVLFTISLEWFSGRRGKLKWMLTICTEDETSSTVTKPEVTMGTHG